MLEHNKSLHLTRDADAPLAGELNRWAVTTWMDYAACKR